MDVIEFYNRMKNASLGLPEWNALHPQEQNMIIQSVNLLLAVCHNHGVTGKTTEENT